jgi:hypothetical protein
MKNLFSFFLVWLLACSSTETQSQETPSHTVTPTSQVPTKENPKEPTKTTAPPTTPKEEKMIFERGFFRSRRGDVIANFPDVPNGFVLSLSPATVPDDFVFVHLGTSQKWSAYMAFAAIPPKSSEEQAFTFLLNNFVSKGYNLTLTGDKTSFTVSGGAGKKQALAGAMANGTKMLGEIRVISDGNAAAGIVLVAVAGNENKFEWLQKELFDSVRVGSKIPTLPAVNPGTPLTGFYKGPLYNAEFTWLVFDPRGYVSDVEPYSTLFFDLAVLYQSKPFSVGTYSISGDKLTMRFTHSSGPRDEVHKLVMTDGHLTLSNDGPELDHDGEYTRVDGSQCDNLKLDGHYEASSFSSTPAPMYGGAAVSVSTSNDLYFSLDGTVRFSSSASVSGTNVAADGTQSPALAGYSGDKDKGTYRIEKNLLYLTFADGSKQIRTFFPRGFDDKGKPKTEGYIINGSTFLKDD